MGSVLNPERTTKTSRLAIAMAMCLALVVGPVLFLVGTSNPRPQTLKAIGVAGAAGQDHPRPTATTPEPSTDPSPTDSVIPPPSGDVGAPSTDVPPPPTTPVTSSAPSIPAKSSVVTVKATVPNTVGTSTVPKATTTTVRRAKPAAVVTTPTTKTPPSTIPALGTPLPPTPTGSVKAAAPADSSFHPSHSATGKASWYHAPDATCASLTIPRGTKVRVTNTANGSSAICTIADYGPTDTSRIIDLSYDTFSKLAVPAAGLIDVHIEW